MKARISELEAENALLRGEVEGERITLTEDEGISKLHTLIEALLPTSKSAIENKAHADLALIAEYLGLPSEGLDKPALVESILTKLKES